MRRVRITIDLTYDETEWNAPDEWDWDDLIGTADTTIHEVRAEVIG